MVIIRKPSFLTRFCFIAIASLLFCSPIWANSDPAASVSSQYNNKLAPASFSKNGDNIARAAVKSVEILIEANSSVPRDEIALWAIYKILDYNAEWLNANGIRFWNRRGLSNALCEIIIEFPEKGVSLRYYDSELSAPTHSEINGKTVYKTRQAAKVNSVVTKELLVKDAASRIATPVLPEVISIINLTGKASSDRIRVGISTLKVSDLKEAVSVHNETWGDNFRITLSDAHEMLSNNPGGHLIARDIGNGKIIAVIWCVSLRATSVDDVPGSLKSIIGTRRMEGDNFWLHYAVGVAKEYRDRGFGPEVSGKLLSSTKLLSQGATRGTYSPMNGYGKFKDRYSPTAYLLSELAPAKDGQEKRSYLDWTEKGGQTFREYLSEHEIDPEKISWQDYLDYVSERSGYAMEDYIKKTGRRLACTAANMHVKNGAKIVRVIEGGRGGDVDAGNCAFISIYPGKAFPEPIRPKSMQLEVDEAKSKTGGNLSGVVARAPPLDTTEILIGAMHAKAGPGLASGLVGQGPRVLLSASLFDYTDRANLDRLLKGTNVQILEPEEIKHRATNNTAVRDKIAVVLHKEDFDSDDVWSDADKNGRVKSSVLILNDGLKGDSYLYLEGVVGLAVAIMRQDRSSIKELYQILSGAALDEAVLELLKDDAISFAIKAALKFKPIMVEDRDKIERYKLSMETFLSAA